MPSPRNSGQLDQISQAIGQLEGRFDGIEQYIHDRRHDDKNVSQKIDGLSGQITREVTRMKAEIQVQLEAMDSRIAALEAAGQRVAGAKSVVVWVMQSPLIGWLFALGVVVWETLKGGHKP